MTIAPSILNLFSNFLNWDVCFDVKYRAHVSVDPGRHSKSNRIFERISDLEKQPRGSTVGENRASKTAAVGIHDLETYALLLSMSMGLFYCSHACTPGYRFLIFPPNRARLGTDRLDPSCLVQSTSRTGCLTSNMSSNCIMNVQAARGSTIRAQCKFSRREGLVVHLPAYFFQNLGTERRREEMGKTAICHSPGRHSPACSGWRWTTKHTKGYLLEWPRCSRAIGHEKPNISLLVAKGPGKRTSQDGYPGDKDVIALQLCSRVCPRSFTYDLRAEA
ncbi:unnamed protein product, partial [Nesidiocoris tenuis]